MPHINQFERGLIKNAEADGQKLELMRDVNGRLVQPGVVVYLVTRELCRRWKIHRSFKMVFEVLQYQHVIHVLLQAKVDYLSGEEFTTAFFLAYLDFYLRVMQPYEAQKADENGDVYLEEGVLPKEGEWP